MTQPGTPGSGTDPGDTMRSPGADSTGFHIGQSSSGQILLAPGFKPAFDVQDLLPDPLLAAAPRVRVLGRNVPALDGIPLLYKLGQGGMGAVYYGYHPRLDREVAVKVLPQQLAAQNPDLVQRFFREARIAAKVRSNHLVGVLDVDQDGGLFFIVMEFIAGGSVRGYVDKLKKAGQVGAAEAIALEICIAASKGLAEAHNQGIVHRDIKPDNILLPKGPDGNPLFSEAKLADLGLARGEGQDTGLTIAHSSMGTPGYLAPEQATDAHTAGAPADVYGLGATLYAMLVGHAPFTGTSAMKIMMDTVQKPHPPVRSMRPDIAPDTAALLDKCLAKDAGQRFTNGTQLLAALQSCHAKFGPLPSGHATGTRPAAGAGGSHPPPVPAAGHTGSVPAINTGAVTAVTPASAHSGYAPQPRTGLPFAIKALLGCMGICVLLGGGTFGLLLWYGFSLRSEVAEAVNAQLGDLQRKDIDSAYTRTSQGFRDATSRKEFDSFVKRFVVLRNFQSASLPDVNYNIDKGNETGTVKGTLTAADGSTAKAEFTVVKEAGTWKIQHIKIEGVETADESSDDSGIFEPHQPVPMRQEGKTRISRLVVGLDPDAQGRVRINRTALTKRDGAIHVNAYVEDASAGVRITASMEDAKSKYRQGPITQQITQDGATVCTFSFAPPGGGWQAGRYEITVYISGGVKSTQTVTIR